MNKSNLIIVGAGGHSRSCIDTIEQNGKFRIGGLVGLAEEVGSSHFGYEILTTDSGLAQLVKRFPYAIVALGQINSSEHRIRLYEKLLAVGFILPTIISSSAYVSKHAKIGMGTIVMHGAVINAGAMVGDNCIINSNALLEHDSRVADHCHISTGAILNGETRVGPGSFVGSGATVKEGVTVGARSLIGMGLSVRHDLEENSSFISKATS